MMRKDRRAWGLRTLVVALALLGVAVLPVGAAAGHEVLEPVVLEIPDYPNVLPKLANGSGTVVGMAWDTDPFGGSRAFLREPSGTTRLLPGAWPVALSESGYALSTEPREQPSGDLRYQLFLTDGEGEAVMLPSELDDMAYPLVTAINRDGAFLVTVGTGVVDPEDHHIRTRAYLIRPGHASPVFEFQPPGVDECYALALTDAGRVLLASDGFGANGRAWVWDADRPAEYVDLGAGWPYGMNQAGQVLLARGELFGARTVWVWEDAGETVVPFHGSLINDRGVVLGWDETGAWLAMFETTTGRRVEIPRPPESLVPAGAENLIASPVDMNAEAEVLCQLYWSISPSSGAYVPAVWSEARGWQEVRGTGWDGAEAEGVWASDLNDAGLVVGSGHALPEPGSGYPDTRGYLWDVRTLPDTPSEGVEFTAAMVESLTAGGEMTSTDAAVLQSKLESVAESLEGDQETAAAGKVTAFRNQVVALEKSGRLSSAAADRLLAAADLTLGLIADE